jgi:hypothetical protein
MTRPKAPQPSLTVRRPQQRWLEAAARREAAKARFAALPEEERAAIHARLDRLLFQEAVWRVARTMLSNPHSYCHRKHFTHDEDFCWLITMLREGGVGERQKFHGRWYDTLVRPHPVTQVECRFWCMGWPLNLSDGRWCTVIINRKPVLPEDR